MKNYPKFISYIILFLFFFGVIYFYFANSQTRTIYGDDLSIYKEQADNTHISDIIAAGKSCTKFRPLFGIVSYLEVHLIHKSLFVYFLFNVAMQALIALVFSVIVNLLLRSLLLSALTGLLVALSRFNYYNIIQVMCGGPLEDLAMLLFLAALYNIVVYLTYNSASHSKSRFYYLAWAIVYANLATYTHERYIVLFPVIIIAALFHPIENVLSVRQKLVTCFFSAASVFVNFALKEYIYHYQFLLGTNSPIAQSFNLKKQFSFLGDALASIVQFNSEPDYMNGIAFHNVSNYHKILVLLAIIILCTLVCWYIFSNILSRSKKAAGPTNSIKLILFLMLIFSATLAPAVSTTVLEQRWLQAPFALFVLIVVVVFANISTSHTLGKKYFFVFFVLTFLTSDYIYKYRLDRHFWMKSSEWMATLFRNAALSDVVGKEPDRIYILKDKWAPTEASQMNWVLWFGYSFDFYQGKSKTIAFLDSTKYTDSTQLRYMINFDRKSEQIVRIGEYGLMNVTDTVLTQRDKYFKEHGIIAKNY